MNATLNRVTRQLLLGALAAVLLTTSGYAQRRLNDTQVRNLLNRIEQRSTTFQNSLNLALDRTRFDRTRRENEINRFVSDFTASTAQLRDRFDNGRIDNRDVEDVLTRANYINSFVARERLDSRTQSNWNALRTDLNTLARAWNINWDWNNAAYSINNDGSVGGGYRDNDPYRNSGYRNGGYRGNNTNALTGTWRLNVARSDDPRTVIDQTIGGTSTDDRVEENLRRRLEAPETLALDRRGNEVTMVSSSGAQVTFTADGREVTETRPNGRQQQTRSTLVGNRLTIKTTGDRGNDYEVSFEPVNNGQQLRVTRSFYNERINREVVVRSVYDRTSDTAQLNIYNDRPDSSPNYPNRTTGARGGFTVPDGTVLEAALNTDLSTRQAHEGDRVMLTVRGPREWDNATIEGRVVSAERSGRVSGRAGLQLDFERIRLENGQSYNFAGTIERVTLPNGESVRIDREGNVEEDRTQTSRTVTRGAIGGAIGAIIGAIAGGGSGAAIGAAVGAGAGAGTIFIQGRDDLDLPVGTTLSIRASAPRGY